MLKVLSATNLKNNYFRKPTNTQKQTLPTRSTIQ